MQCGHCLAWCTQTQRLMWCPSRQLFALALQAGALSAACPAAARQHPPPAPLTLRALWGLLLYCSIPRCVQPASQPANPCLLLPFVRLAGIKFFPLGRDYLGPGVFVLKGIPDDPSPQTLPGVPINLSLANWCARLVPRVAGIDNSSHACQSNDCLVPLGAQNLRGLI